MKEFMIAALLVGIIFSIGYARASDDPEYDKIIRSIKKLGPIGHGPGVYDPPKKDDGSASDDSQTNTPPEEPK
jgi:hypothetical protein